MSGTLIDPLDGPIPETHWTPEQQIAHMLDLCEAQMEAALTESDKAVDALIKAFGVISETSGAQEAISKNVASAIVAFQFYDKLTQRLGHVRYSLSTLAMFVCDRSQSARRDQWKKLFSALKRLYRTEEERAIFTLVTQGVSANEAREQVQASTHVPAAEEHGTVELF
jgi:hypothetical protein